MTSHDHGHLADNTTELRFMTTSEVAAILCVSIETLRSWRNRGTGPKSFKIPNGRRVLFAREDVEAFIQSGSGRPLQPMGYMTTGEVADLLRVPPETVRYWRHEGRGPKAFKIPGGRAVLYAREDVDLYIARARGVLPAEPNEVL